MKLIFHIKNLFKNLKKKFPFREINFTNLIFSREKKNTFRSYSAEHDEEKLNNLLDHLLSTGIVCDGTVANSPSHQQQLWPLRERIAEALLRDGYCYKYDISLPYDTFYER